MKLIHRQASTFLWALLVVQAIALTVVVVRIGRSSAAPRSRTPVVGDTIPFVAGLDLHGKPDTVRLIRDSGWTVVLAFLSTCPHCETVAPAWSKWLAVNRPNVATVAITQDTPADADTYRRRHLWRTRVVAIPRPGIIERGLTNFTPWLFVFDPRGRLALAQHGSRLAAVDSVLQGRAP